MRVVLPREEFLEAAGWVARILPPKPVNPVLGGVKITADLEANLVRFSAFDTEMSAEIDVSDGEVETSGEVLVSGRLLAAIGRALPKKAVALELPSGANIAVLTCGKSEFTLPTMKLGAYPALPTLPEDSAMIDADELADAFARVLPAIETDDALPWLCAVHLEFVNDQILRLTTTDKTRCAITELSWTGAKGIADGKTLLVPSRAVNEIRQLSGADVFLGFTEASSGVLGIHTANRRTTTRLIDHGFPNVGQILPKNHDAVVQVVSEDLAGILQRALLMDDTDFPRVHLEFTTDEIRILGGKDDVGGYRDSIPAKLAGIEQSLTLNPRYLLDALAGAGSYAMIGLQGPKKLLAIRASEKDEPVTAGKGLRGPYLYLLQPLAE